MPRFYVTMTWDNFPEGGSYGTIVTAADTEEAEGLVREEMAAHREGLYDADLDLDDQSVVDAETDRIVETYINAWHLVDCFDLDAFIGRHRVEEEAAKWAPLMFTSVRGGQDAVALPD